MGKKRIIAFLILWVILVLVLGYVSMRKVTNSTSVIIFSGIMFGNTIMSAILIVGLLFITAGEESVREPIRAHTPKSKLLHCRKCRNETKHNKIGGWVSYTKYQCQICGENLRRHLLTELMNDVKNRSRQPGQEAHRPGFTVRG